MTPHEQRLISRLTQARRKVEMSGRCFECGDTVTDDCEVWSRYDGEAVFCSIDCRDHYDEEDEDDEDDEEEFE
jgi:hypothetical protein